MSWTDDRVETLKRMWGEGQSASQIAKELGGVTRNAVIGKVHRLGLSNRAGSGGNAGKAAAKEKVPSKPAAPKAPPKSKTKAAPASKPTKQEPELDENGIPISAARRAIIPAGQPLLPQPSLWHSPKLHLYRKTWCHHALTIMHCNFTCLRCQLLWHCKVVKLSSAMP